MIPFIPRQRAPSASRPGGLTALACLAALAGSPDRADAARPMITDDARIVDAQACQVESWVRSFHSGGHEFWALPGCNPFGGFEMTLGGAALRPDGSPGDSAVQGQVKTLFRSLSPDGWGWGLAVGTLDVLPRSGSGSRNAPYAYVPASFAFMGERLVTHVNLGLTRAAEGRSGADGTWGAGLEFSVVPRALVIAEGFGVTGQRAQGQLGVRWWVVPDRVQIDATWGRQGGPDGVGTWVSIGLRLLSPPFLP